MLLEGAIIGAADCSKAKANEALLHEHVCLLDEARVQAAKLAPMHVVNWEDAQGADAVLAACRKWLKACKDTPAEERDALLRKYLGSQADTEEGRTLFHICNSLVLSKGLLYISMIPKGELAGVLVFLVPSSQCTTALNSVHQDAGHQGQQRMLGLVQEHFWWPMMVEDCKWVSFAGETAQARISPLVSEKQSLLCHACVPAYGTRGWRPGHGCPVGVPQLLKTGAHLALGHRLGAPIPDHF